MKKVLSLLLMGLFMATAVVPVFAAEKVTMEGVLNEDSMFVSDDGTVYGVADNEAGAGLMELIEQKVRVTGSVVETEDGPVMVIESYEVIEG